MDEPSLLDYLREKLNPRRLLAGGSGAPGSGKQIEEEKPPQPIRESSLHRFPWRSLLALLLALVGQRFFEPGASLPQLGIAFHLVAGGFLLLALVKEEWRVTPLGIASNSDMSAAVNRMPLFFFIPTLVLTFFSFSGNRFTGLSLLLWAATFSLALAAFWQRGEQTADWNSFKARAASALQRRALHFQINWWNLLVVAVLLLSAFFHLSQLSSVPLDMTSDHAEKILDVSAVLDGHYSIFFPRNAGREPLQFYLTAALVRFFGQELGFTTLKLGMALVFLLSLYYVYRLGAEVGSRWTGLLSMLLVGFASWTNILARSGMRLVLTPVFVAPVLFYLLRGLRQCRRNDLLLAGIFLGLGLLGYSAFRIMPVMVLFTVVIFIAYQHKGERKPGVSVGFGVLLVFTLVMALPLLRFATQYPQLIAYRTVTRMTGAEQAIGGSAALVFLHNFWNAALMPFWRNGNTWVISVTDRPALDLVSAALYLLGVVTLIYAWLRQRAWQYLVLLLSIPVFMLPSMLALAFPLENPSLSRAGGAVIPILIAAAIALETLLSSLWRAAKSGGSKALIILFGTTLLILSAAQNYDLVFHQYRLQYQNATWNTRQMGEIARNYVDSIGDPDSVFVLAVPHWVDTRLVAMNAGYLERDFAIWADDLESTTYLSGPKMFFVKANDTEGMNRLIQLYPNGFSQFHTSPAPGREFFTYLVPPLAAGQFQD